MLVAGAVTLVTVLAVIPLVSAQSGPGTAAPSPSPGADPGLEKIEHVIFIVQENRSFDHYFGVYESPNGDNVNGIPRTPGGAFAARTCNWHPVLNKCLKPYHSTIDRQIGGPHGHKASVIDINGGKMNGFIEGAASGPFTRKCVLQPFA